MLANKKDWKLWLILTHFFNAISLTVFLITEKWVNFYLCVLFFSDYYSEQDSTAYFIRKLTNLVLFLNNLVVSGSKRNWNDLWMRFPQKTYSVDSFILGVYYTFKQSSGADPGFCVRGDEIRQGDLRVLLLLSQLFMERMMQEN